VWVPGMVCFLSFCLSFLYFSNFSILCSTDDKAPNCQLCGQNFTILYRRHHCRGNSQF
jgi:hypothetical protein